MRTRPRTGQRYPEISDAEIWLWTGCASLAQNEAVETFAAGLEAQFNRLESNRGMENGMGGSSEGATFRG